MLRHSTKKRLRTSKTRQTQKLPIRHNEVRVKLSIVLRILRINIL